MTPRYESDHKKKILAAVILLLVLLAAAALSCQVKTVTVTGTKWYTAQQIESMVMEGRWGHSTVLGYVKNRFGAHRSIPFVEDYKVVYRTPFEAEIIVYEKSIVGYVVYMSSNMYFDKDGIIVESNKFCEYWSYERTIDTIVLNRDFGLPVCSIEKEYINSASGQLRTRFQAFIESIEIKKIQEGK